jgi:hypothetical protein
VTHDDWFIFLGLITPYTHAVVWNCEDMNKYGYAKQLYREIGRGFSELGNFNTFSKPTMTEAVFE